MTTANASHSSGDSSHLSFLAGTSAGVTKFALGYPLDTLKVLLQTSPRSAFPPPFSTPKAFVRTLQDHGIKGLYRGGTLPLVGWACTDGLMLGVMKELRKELYAGGQGIFTEADPRSRRHGEIGDARRLTLTGHLLAGSGAGLCCTLVSHPLDHVKSKMQASLRSSTQLSASCRAIRAAALAPTHALHHPAPIHLLHHELFPSHLFHPSLVQQRFYHSLSRPLIFKAARPPPPSYSSPVECAVALVRDGKLWRAVGWSATLRSGMGVMFASYEVALRTLEPTALPTPVKTFVSGSFAALFFWSLALPADNIRARFLTDSHVHPRYHSTRQVIRAIWRQNKKSVWAFWRGGGAVSLRAGAVNGCSLMVWEATMRCLGERTFS